MKVTKRQANAQAAILAQYRTLRLVAQLVRPAGVSPEQMDRAAAEAWRTAGARPTA